MNNKLIKINLNQTISRFELAEVKKEKNKWITFSVLSSFFILILLFNYLFINKYHVLISSRIEDTSKLEGAIKEIQDQSRVDDKSYNVNLSISQSDINTLHKIESDRISLAKKLEALVFDIPETMSILDIDYSYSRKEMIVALISEIDTIRYDQNKKAVISNLKNNFFKDGDFNAYDIRPIQDTYKQQSFYKMILTLSKD